MMLQVLLKNLGSICVVALTCRAWLMPYNTGNTFGMWSAVLSGAAAIAAIWL